MQTEDELIVKIKQLENKNKILNQVIKQSALIKKKYNESKKLLKEKEEEILDLNNNLFEKVKKEVAKNRSKDQLLAEQSKMASMGEMIGAIAHQWRQPLNALGMQIQFFEDDFEDDLIDKEYVQEFSHDSMKLINFMSKTIDNFRNFFRTDKTKVVFSVENGIKDVINILSSQLENHNIKLIVNGDDFSTLGVQNEFQQVALNIINNSRDALMEIKSWDFNQNSPKIEILLEVKKDKGIIQIKDNAGGIPNDIINKVFEPYFTTKEQGKGTGIGLYMSKTIIEKNMNGQLTILNDKEGAVFFIELPLSQ